MGAIPVPNADETRDNAAFSALMWALSRPGSVQRLPGPGMVCAALALVDLETAVFADDPGLAAALSRTGARMVEMGRADYLFVTGTPQAAAEAAATGSAAHPEGGAMIIAVVPHAGGPRLRLTGPGIDGAAEIAPALPPAFWAARARRIAYPLGFDLFLIDGDRVIGLPRSTAVEVP